MTARLEIQLDTGIIARFSSFDLTPTNLSAFAISEDGRYAIKIEMASDDGKHNDLMAEAAIIRMLEARGCQTCPRVLGLGKIARDTIAEPLGRSKIVISPENPLTEFTYLAMPAYAPMNPIVTPDILMAIIEQKKLGVWHADISPQNTLMDPLTSCIKLIDYDQAVWLDDDQIVLDNLAYFDWVNEEQRGHYRAPYQRVNWLHEFPGATWEKLFAPLFRGTALNIGGTHLLQSSETTLGHNKLYHLIDTPDVFSDGERSLDARRALLDEVAFEPGERVLDIGCNAGLLCHYLLDRGCETHGVDIDPSVVIAARILANILGKGGIRFDCLDIDNGGPYGHFDTIMLFSVIHHTRNIEANAERIAMFCRRIVIECRLNESGAKPVNGQWIETTVWRHDDEAGLIKGLEALFPGFHHARTVGQADRDRYIMELVKD